MDLSFLPAVNAGLNAIAGTLLVLGWVVIRRDRQANRALHRRIMTTAFAVSCLFLISYLTHYGWRASVEGGTHTRPSLTGTALTAYFVFLVAHILFAAAVPFLALNQFRLAIQGKFDAHRRWGMITMPVWLYTSVTGVLIFFVLYVWFPPIKDA